MPLGSGAIVVHRQLAETIPGYRVRPFDPRLEVFPPLLCGLRNPKARILHATPDQGTFTVSHGQSLVVTFHNFVLDDEAQRFAGSIQRIHYRTDLRWLTQRAIQRAVAITSVSAYTAALVESFFELRQPVRVIENGIDTEVFFPRNHNPAGPVRVLVSGNASRRKGTHLIGDIARQLAPGVEIACTLDRDELLHWVGNHPNVRALGKQSADAMPAVYREADILLMPTAREGFGLAVAEAMASGLPIVASDTSTMPGLVAHDKGGFLCSLDDPAEFATRINALATAPGMRMAMGKFNRERALQRFSLTTMIGNYRLLFDEVLEGSR